LPKYLEPLGVAITPIKIRIESIIDLAWKIQVNTSFIAVALGL